MTFDRVLFGTLLEAFEDVAGGCTCVGEEGIEDQVGLGVEVAAGTLQVSKDVAVALHECLRDGPPTTSNPGDGIEDKEPRYREE